MTSSTSTAATSGSFVLPERVELAYLTGTLSEPSVEKLRELLEIVRPRFARRQQHVHEHLRLAAHIERNAISGMIPISTTASIG